MDKKELIYKAAIKVIAREGFNNMKMQMVADEADIAVGTIYNYFECKDALLDYIILIEHARRLKFIDGLEKNGQPALDNIKAFLRFHLDTLIEDIDVCKVLVQEVILIDIPLGDNAKASVVEMQERLSKMIVKAQEEGTVRNSDPQILLITLLNTIKGFMYSLLNKRDINEYASLKIKAIDFLINGIRA